jgi:hypothetical protein
MVEKEKIIEKKIVVVKELPVFPSRNVLDDQGKEVECITTEEAVLEILEIARELRKKI